MILDLVSNKIVVLISFTKYYWTQMPGYMHSWILL